MRIIGLIRIIRHYRIFVVGVNNILFTSWFGDKQFLMHSDTIVNYRVILGTCYVNFSSTLHL